MAAPTAAPATELCTNDCTDHCTGGAGARSPSNATALRGGVRVQRPPPGLRSGRPVAPQTARPRTGRRRGALATVTDHRPWPSPGRLPRTRRHTDDILRIERTDAQVPRASLAPCDVRVWCTSTSEMPGTDLLLPPTAEVAGAPPLPRTRIRRHPTSSGSCPARWAENMSGSRTPFPPPGGRGKSVPNIGARTGAAVIKRWITLLSVRVVGQGWIDNERTWVVRRRVRARAGELRRPGGCLQFPPRASRLAIR